jgi:hypothetical protein
MYVDFRITKLLIKPTRLPAEKNTPVIQRVRIRLSRPGLPRRTTCLRVHSTNGGTADRIENRGGRQIPSTGYLFVGDPILNLRSPTILIGDLIVIAMLGGKDRELRPSGVQNWQIVIQTFRDIDESPDPKRQQRAQPQGPDQE